VSEEHTASIFRSSPLKREVDTNVLEEYTSSIVRTLHQVPYPRRIIGTIVLFSSLNFQKAGRLDSELHDSKHRTIFYALDFLLNAVLFIIVPKYLEMDKVSYEAHVITVTFLDNYYNQFIIFYK
jgi:hypothetical protein